nr:hypothetical protein [Bacteroides intestinalis]
MKRTTYIIFGMLLAGLVVVCGGIFYTFTQMGDWNDSVMEIGGERKTTQLPECKVIQLVSDKETVDDNGDVRVTAFNSLPLKVSQTNNPTGTFTYISGLDKYMTLNSVGDTLRISLNFDRNKLEKKYKDIQWLNIRSEEMVLTLPANVQQVTSNLRQQTATFKDFDCDSLSFSIDYYVEIENCRFKALFAQSGDLQFNSGEVSNLHLNLDGINNWTVKADAFYIDTEYLYASDKSECTLEKGECKQVVWIPQSRDASLDIKLKEAAKIMVTE